MVVLIVAILICMYNEIRKKPHDAELEKLKKDLLNAMKNYSEWRRKWSYMSYAEKSEWDAERTKCHNAFIGCVDKLAFYMEEQGMYEQDNDASNGKEEIEWIVLEKSDEKLLMISKYALDDKPYNAERKANIWEESSLRTWMKNTFINEAFLGDISSAIGNISSCILTIEGMEEFIPLGDEDVLRKSTDERLQELQNSLIFSSVDEEHEPLRIISSEIRVANVEIQGIENRRKIGICLYG